MWKLSNMFAGIARHQPLNESITIEGRISNFQYSQEEHTLGLFVEPGKFLGVDPHLYRPLIMDLSNPLVCDLFKQLNHGAEGRFSGQFDPNLVSYTVVNTNSPSRQKLPLEGRLIIGPEEYLAKFDVYSTDAIHYYSSMWQLLLEKRQK